MFWKKTGLICLVVCIDLGALGVVAYGDTSGQQKAHSATLQAPSGYLGVAVQDLDAKKMNALNLKDSAGVAVTVVAPGEAGAKAGVHLDDVILEINGQKVDSAEEFTSLIIGKSPGTKVSLLILRKGVKQTMVATLGLRPAGLPVMVPSASTPQSSVTIQTPFGPMSSIPMTPDDIAAMMAGNVPRPLFGGEPLGEQLAAFFGVHEGVLVQTVFEKTAAERAGLKAGDVVTKVNGMPVASLREISAVVRQTNKKVVIFTVVRDKKEITLTVEIAWNRDPNDRDVIN
jgi:serine protease Do